MADRQGMPQYNMSFQQQQQMRNQQAQQQQHAAMGFNSAQQQMWQQSQNQLRSQALTEQQLELLRAQQRLQGQPTSNFMGVSAGNPAAAIANPAQAYNMAHMAHPGVLPGQQPRSPAMQQQQQQQQQHALQNTQHHARQLELMGMAQNQQNQNNFPARAVPGKPSQAAQPNFANRTQQTDIFTPSMAGDSLRRASPGNPTHQGNPHANNPVYQRAAMARQRLQDIEQQLRELNTNRAGMSDQIYHNKLQQMNNELRQRRDTAQKYGQMWSTHIQGGNANAGVMAALASSGQSPSWMNQAGLQPQNPSNMPSDIRSPQQRNIQASPAQPHSNPQDPAAALRSIVPQQAVPPFNPAGRTSVQAHHAYQQQQQQAASSSSQPTHDSSVPYPPPLDKSKFEQTFKSFCTSQKVQLDERLLSIDNRRIDLFMLHMLVLREGGFKAVSQRDQWAAIGGVLGFVHFPATGSEQPKAGPGVANMIENAYKTYLLEFETAYVNSQQSMKARMQNNIVESFNRSTPEQQNVLLNYSRRTVEELRGAGLPDRMISLIEHNRAFLQQRAAERSAAFANANQAHPVNGPINPVLQPQSPAPAQQPTPDMLQRQRMIALQQAQQAQQHHQAQQAAQAHGQPAQPSNPQAQNPVVRTLINMASAVGIPHPQLAQAYKWCQERKHEFASRVATMPAVDVVPERRAEYNDLFAMLYRLVADLDDKLPLFFVMTKDTERVRRLLGITSTVSQQNVNLTQAQTQLVRYLISVESVKEMLPQVQHALEHFSTVYQQFRNKVVLGQNQNQHPQQGMSPRMQPPHSQPGMPAALPSRVSMPSQPLPPQVPQQQQQQQQQQHPYLTAPEIPQPPQPPLHLQAPPAGVMRKASATSPAAMSEMQALTPASAPTPSQPTPPSTQPVSPKTKKAKPVPKPKKLAKASTPTVATASTPATDTSHPIPASTSAAALNSSGKRAREEDVTHPSKIESSNSPAPHVGDEQGPATKRIKSEWTGPLDAAVVKKQEAVGNVKTDEDATGFLEQMAELLRTAVADGADNNNLSETLDILLKGCSNLPDSPDAHSNSIGGDTSGTGGDVSMSSAALESVDEFFDFSSFLNAEEDELIASTSKAPTPDLVASSSTNPSPESESDSTNQQSPPHPHLFSQPQPHPRYPHSDAPHEDHDPLALGTFKEIDGGVSSFYQTTDWKWEGSMQPLDWAILPALPGGS